MNEEPETRVHNHDLLIQLKAGVDTLVVNFKKFQVDQAAENKLLHSRITETQEKFMERDADMKEAIAARGRITAPYVAIMLSVLTIIGGVGAHYVDMQDTPLKTAIISNSGAITTSHLERQALNSKLQETAIASAVADARSTVDREWIVKLLDEGRKKP
jgi:hypothetical protein